MPATGKLEDQITQLRMQRSSVAEFGLYAFRARDLDELLQRTSALVSEVLDVDLVKVLEHLPERHEMLMRAGVNWQPGVIGHERLADSEGSPGGYALRSDAPVISHDVAAETRFGIPEVLRRHGVKSMVNVVVPGEQRPFGVLEVDARRRRHFDEDDIAFLQNCANLLAAAIERLRSNLALQRSADEQSILARELSHRVQNVLSVVQALAAQTDAAGRSGAEYRDAFMGRLRALAAAEALVFDDRDERVDLRGLAEAVLEPHWADRPRSIEVAGPPCQVAARNGRMLGLALHELATNAAKYGALSTGAGHVRLEWDLLPGTGAPDDRDRAGDRPGDPAPTPTTAPPPAPDQPPDAQAAPLLRLVWSETGGPGIAPPGRKGFGSRLLEQIVSEELEGEARLDFRPTGLVYRLTFRTGPAAPGPGPAGASGRAPSARGQEPPD